MMSESQELITADPAGRWGLPLGWESQRKPQKTCPFPLLGKIITAFTKELTAGSKNGTGMMLIILVYV